MADGKTIPNIDYLGRTWDVVTMDPLDLGSTSKNQNVIDISVADGDTVNTRDGYYSIPKGVRHDAPFSMHWETASGTISSSYELQKELKVAVEADAGVEGGFEFSVSGSSRDMEGLTQTRKRTYVYSLAFQQNHILDLDLDNINAPLTVTPEFQDAVLALPYQDEVPDWEQKYADFIDRFGTHFTKSIVLGGLAQQRTSGIASTYLKSSESEQTLKSKASVQYEAVKGGASTDVAKQESSRTDQESSLTREYLDFRGGQGSTASITDQWITTLLDYPAPVKAKLERLSYLVSSRFFPDQDYIEDLQGLLDRAITDWIQTKGTPSSNTAPLRYGEPVVMVLPWSDGKTKQISVFEANVGNPIQFPVENSGKPSYTQPTIGLRILSSDGSNKDGVILAGDQIRIEAAGQGFVNRDIGVTRNSSDAARFTILHYDDNPNAPGRIGEYFQSSDLVRILRDGVADNALGISNQRELRLWSSGNVTVTGFLLVRCAEQEES